MPTRTPSARTSPPPPSPATAPITSTSASTINSPAGADLTARYSFSDRDFFEPYGGQTYSQIPGFGNNVPRRAQNALLGYTQAFSPNAINELRVSFNRVALSVSQQNQGADLNRQVGLPTVVTNPRQNGLTYVSVVGWSPLGDEFNNPQASVTNTYQIADQFTVTRGASTFKFGGEIRKLEQNAYRDVQARGPPARATASSSAAR